MRITNVRAVQPATPTSPPDWRTSLGQILVAVETDAGITGYGVGGGGLAGIHVVRTVLRDVLIGEDPDQVESLWLKMYNTTLPYGQKGLAIMALSGVDLALWDIRGRAANKPIAELLGGSVGESIPTYITIWHDIEQAFEQGYRAFKLHVEGRDRTERVADVVEAVSHARSVVGSDPELMIDAWMQWDIESTLAAARELKSFNLSWIEEPLPADDFEGYEQLRDECPIPIAGGEHEFTSKAFARLINDRLHQVLQPDVCWCGGMTELIRIYEMGNAAGLRVCPHRGSEIWSLHAIAALDRQPLAESGRPWMTWVNGQPPTVDGYIQLTNAAGFGIDIDEDNLETIQ